MCICRGRNTPKCFVLLLINIVEFCEGLNAPYCSAQTHSYTFVLVSRMQERTGVCVCVRQRERERERVGGGGWGSSGIMKADV